MWPDLRNYRKVEPMSSKLAKDAIRVEKKIGT